MNRTLGSAVAASCALGMLGAGESAVADPTTTVITHGYSQTKGSWVQAMGQAVVARLGAGAVYRLNATTGQWDLVSSSGDRSANIALVFNWADESDMSGWGYAAGAADALYAALRDPQFRSADGPAPVSNMFTGRKAQFIGHSRGASVMSEVIQRLAVAAIPVDQFTTLDPHPVNGTLDACILPMSTNWGDAVPRKWNNVAWADDYWRADGGGLNACDFDGMPLTGFNNVGLSESALNSGGYSFSHSDVHLWYHGTIDLAPNPSDGEQSITNAMRTGWYPGGYTMVGYYFASNGGGAGMRAAQAAGDAPGIVPTVYGGTFDQGSTAGWEFHGGGGDGVIMNGAGNDGFLRLGAGTANPGPFGSARTHNFMYVPANANAVLFSTRIIEADAGTPDDALVVTLQGPAGMFTLGSILLDHTTGWVSGSMAIPAAARGRTATMTFMHSHGAVSESVVDIDNVALGFAPPCPADLNGDGSVNSGDLASLLGAWGVGGGSADLNGDGMVNATDLGLLLGSWGACP